LLSALGEAGDLSPVAGSRLLRRTVSACLGWRARLVAAPSPLVTEDRARLEDGVAVVPVAPGAGALLLSGGADADLRRVAALCAMALARARAHPVEAGRHARRPSRPRILLADDDPAARAELARLLSPDHQVLAAADGAAAVALARSARPDAVVLDLTRPGLDGLGALAELRTDPTTADTPALLLAAGEDVEHRLRALDLGADFLAKPFSGAELRARLSRALRLSRSARALREEAMTDPLTGLPNRRALEARLAEETRRAQRYRTPLSCVMADLDRLKPINDLLGHAVGDQALQAMASVLRAQLRETDFAARAGGDEFVLVLPHTTAAEARVLAERVRARLGRVRVGPVDRAARVQASFGVATLGPGADGETMVAAADRALYEAKRAGRAEVRVAGERPPAPRARTGRPRRAARRAPSRA
jgi:diguanylate cyclase (GGDEF)-like protein